MILSEDQINSFKQNGVLVVPNILSDSEILQAREGLHHFLISSKAKCDVLNLESTAAGLTKLSSTGGSGGILDVFYEDWKLNVNQHPQVVAAIQNLWFSTWCDDTHIDGLYKHPYGKFDPRRGYMYIDRICFRLPTTIVNSLSEQSGTVFKKSKLLQRSLTPHLDCCPHNMFSKSSRKWRPIQAFVALTDNDSPESGGFEACLGFHRDFDEWSQSRRPSIRRYKNSNSADNSTNAIDSQEEETLLPPPCVGDFTPIRPLEDKEVIDRFVSIPYKAGDLVCWDYRIPHANSRFNHSSIAREAIYIGLLPAIPLNKQYAMDQLERFRAGLNPIDQWLSPAEKSVKVGGPLCTFNFSDLGSRLMGIKDWNEE